MRHTSSFAAKALLALLGASLVILTSDRVGSIENTHLTPHEHRATTITSPPGDSFAVDNPDGIDHQHRQAIHHGGSEGDARGRFKAKTDPLYVAGQNYDAYAVWDARARRDDDKGTFDEGHGFIDGNGYGYNAPIKIRYKFSPTHPPPGTSAEQTEFKNRVNEAFAAYEALQDASGTRVTGIAFELVAGTKDADVTVLWKNMTKNGETSPGAAPLTVAFDRDTSAGGGVNGWETSADIGQVGNNEFYFFHTALHEVGHVVGLDHDLEANEVMIRSRNKGCPGNPLPPNPDNRGPCLNALSPEETNGSLDLYTIPGPDFGDAPDDYPTKLRLGVAADRPSRGARAFGITQEWLGPSGNSTTTRERTPNQDGLDAGDDGCSVAGLARPGVAGANSVNVTVSYGNAARYAGANLLRIAVWVDFDEDKDWTVSEQAVLASLNPTTPTGWTNAGTNSFERSFPITVPAGPESSTWMRCRLAFASSNTYLAGNKGDEAIMPAGETPNYSGAAGGEDNAGEIEDYLVLIEGEECSGGLDEDGDTFIDLSDTDCSDGDSDGWADSVDNCSSMMSSARSDLDDDGEGDTCDVDDDDDGDLDGSDNCPEEPNPSQANNDGDWVGDACDPDDDNDDFSDSDEGDLGSSPTSSSSTPEDEMLADSCEDIIDNDGDAMTDENDPGCPDFDGDGLADAVDDDDDNDSRVDVEEWGDTYRTDPFDVDTDDDGCADGEEDETKASVAAGGGRDPRLFWDFFDTPNSSNVRNKAVSAPDFFNVLGRFGSSGSPAIDPLSAPPAAPAYHSAFDRGPSSGPNAWNLTAANGSIAAADFFAVLSQFGHSCVAPP